MAYDEALAERVRGLIGARSGVTEKRMFGALAWMVGGNMACGVRHDELLVRLGPEGAEHAMAEPHVRQFASADGRSMTGFVVVDPEGVADDDALAGWVDAGADYAASLPPKG
ncbi:MAG TPA: TfoX/Sxy family protein [Solirubrobacteraceae bacterium]|jgi:TfoX/Sxy family transcriptional regulator of competence genes|nr:TfoX/Sxy family protein [Solirubrobacteraceae bacterium]